MLQSSKTDNEHNVMAKKEAARSIVLNVMYNGKYLNENMGHEVINLFKDDNDHNYLIF